MAFLLGLLSFIAFGFGLYYFVTSIVNLFQKNYPQVKRQLMKMATVSVASFALLVTTAILMVNDDPQEVVAEAEQSSAEQEKEADKARLLAEKEKADEEKARLEAEEKKAEEEKRKQEEEALKKAEAEAIKKAEEEAIKKAEAEAAAYQATEEKKINDHLTQLGLVVATIASVVDGDTVKLTDGNKVRLIGVNTPESTNKTEEYGAEASAYTKKALEGKTVYLQKDVSETDRYGRLLRLVWIDVPSDTMNETEIRAKMFNAKLVLDGYAEPSTYNPDVTYSEFFKNSLEKLGKIQLDCGQLLAKEQPKAILIQSHRLHLLTHRVVGQAHRGRHLLVLDPLATLVTPLLKALKTVLQ